MLRLILVLAVIGALGAYGWFMYEAGIDAEQAARAAAIQEQVDQARREERAAQQEVNDELQAQYDDMAAINDRLSGDLERLRNRPDREHVPDDPGADCPPATGAELSRSDARFLTRESARADRLRRALQRCYRYADTVEALNEWKPP